MIIRASSGRMSPQGRLARKDFGKPNIELYGAKNQEWHPASAEVRVEETQEGHRILILPRFEDDEAARSGRAAFPRKVFVEIHLPKTKAEAHITVSCFDKPRRACRSALAHLQPHRGRRENVDS